MDWATFWAIRYALILTKNGLGHILGDFLENSSGHPVSPLVLRARMQQLSRGAKRLRRLLQRCTAVHAAESSEESKSAVREKPSLCANKWQRFESTKMK
jgi:hypothetical protein